MLHNTATLSPQDIVAEVRKFISGAVGPSHSTNMQDVTRAALFLLKNVPATKDAVLEYFCSVFFVAVTKYVRQIEVCVHEQHFIYITFMARLYITILLGKAKHGNTRRKYYSRDSYCSKQFYQWKSRSMGTYHISVVTGITWYFLDW